MAMKWYTSFALLLLAAHFVASLESDYYVPFTPVSEAQSRKAVCLDGSSAGYHFSPGYDDGANNWILYMMGGGWCASSYFCTNKTSLYGSTVNDTTQNFSRILSGRQDINPGSTCRWIGRGTSSHTALRWFSSTSTQSKKGVLESNHLEDEKPESIVKPYLQAVSTPIKPHLYKSALNAYLPKTSMRTAHPKIFPPR